MELPVLDLSVLTQGTSHEQAVFCQTLLDCCAKYGFVKLVNHGIPDDYIAKCFELVNQCTSLLCEFNIR